MITMTDTGPRGLYFEEFEEGTTLTTRARTITESDIVQFAGLTGDYNPMHTDETYAKDSFMEQRVAHGMLTLSYALGQAYQLGILEKTVLAFREVEMKFSLPVLIGDSIHAQLKVVETKAAKRLGGGIVKLDMRIMNQEGKTVQKGAITLLMMSAPEDDAD